MTAPIKTRKPRKKPFAWSETLVAALCEVRYEKRELFKGVKATTPGFNAILEEMKRRHPQLTGELGVDQLQTKWKTLRDAALKYEDSLNQTGEENIDRSPPPHLGLILDALGRDSPVVAGPDVTVESSNRVPRQTIREEVREDLQMALSEDDDTPPPRNQDVGEASLPATRRRRVTENDTDDTGQQPAGGSSQKAQRTPKEPSARKKSRMDMLETINTGFEERQVKLDDYLERFAAQEEEKTAILRTLADGFKTMAAAFSQTPS